MRADPLPLATPVALLIVMEGNIRLVRLSIAEPQCYGHFIWVLVFA
jgi:hypothetical protein